MLKTTGVIIGIAVGLSYFGNIPSAMADDKAMCALCAKAQNEQASYAAKASTTLLRGTANTLLGWTELIYQPAAEVKSGGNVLTGLGKGVSQGISRTLAGVGEVLTFWTPKVQNHYIHFATDCPVCRGKSSPASSSTSH